MAQPSYAIEYLGAMFVKAETSVTSASVLTAFPGATVVKMKTAGVKAGVNGTDMFDITYDDESYLITGKTFIFSKDCTIAVGIYKAVV